MDFGDFRLQFHDIGAERLQQGALQIGAMSMPIGPPEDFLRRIAERGGENVLPRLPVPESVTVGPDRVGGEARGAPEPVQDARRVRAELNTGAHRLDRRGLLQDGEIDPGSPQRQCR